MILTIPYGHYYWVGGPPNLNPESLKALAEDKCRCWLPRAAVSSIGAQEDPGCWTSRSQHLLFMEKSFTSLRSIFRQVFPLNPKP